MPTILAIESSCDETSASVCKDKIILSNIITTQSIHEKYGGVVPELASRAHLQNIVPVVDEALKIANCTLNEIDAFAFTQAPGLIGSLLVGTQYAKSLALAMNKPLIAVHHMQAHVLANLIGNPAPTFPFLCLTVSGGHTQIVKATAPLQLEILGQTIDDAAGEAFDKTAKLLGLPYPGGPLIDKYAALGNPLAFKFTEPQIANLDFSFSGLKTSVLYFLQKQEPTFIQQNCNDLCASIQHTIINILIKKMKLAIAQTGIRQICLAGGVSANKGLRLAFNNLASTVNGTAFIPNFEYCTDNAAMIAITGYYKFLENDFTSLDCSPNARANW
jgi:N6-L-threonylcarbamoyladenine synthase